jgi:hypothetical protein
MKQRVKQCVARSDLTEQHAPQINPNTKVLLTSGIFAKGPQK